MNFKNFSNKKVRVCIYAISLFMIGMFLQTALPGMPNPSPIPGGQYINSDQYIKSGQYLVSDSGKYFAFMQNDGNFCVYKGSGPNDNQGVVWCVTNIPKPIGNYYAIMQGDGNFCVYKGSGPNDNQGVVWCVTNIPKPIGDYFAIMQDDGNFCVYNGSPKHQGAVVWCCKK